MRHRLLSLSVCACALLACDSANPVAPTGSVLSVNASPTQISLSGTSSRITVTGFKPDGNPLNPGTQILVSTDLGDLFDAASSGNLISTIEVGGNGQAIAYLRGDGRPGPATVTAVLTTGGEATDTATVQIGSPDTSQPTVVISANPTTIAVRALSRISLLGRNSDNTPVSAGQRIRLTSDLGTLVEDGGDGNSPTIDSVDTDANGEAFVTFVAGERGGGGQVSAILGTSAEESVSITIRDAIDSLFLNSSKNTVDRIEEGDTVVFTATLQDAQGEPVSGTIVNFTSQRGTFSDNAVPSNAQGEAQAMLTVRRNDVQDILENGTFRVTATATSEGNTRTGTVDITVLGSP